jgi:hypothetical protein
MTTAEIEYAKGHAAALELLAQLQDSIEDMPEPESINGNWGHAGNMSYINGQLRELLAFASGKNT